MHTYIIAYMCALLKYCYDDIPKALDFVVSRTAADTGLYDMCVYIYIYIYTYIYIYVHIVYIYIYIYTEREREIERERDIVYRYVDIDI